MEIIEGKLNGGEEAKRKCPSCHSKKIVNNGLRDNLTVTVQRFLCKDCGHRFSETSGLSRIANNKMKRQVGDSSQRSKNLTEVNPQKIRLAGATKDVVVLEKLIHYTSHMEKQRYKDSTIKLNQSCLKALMDKGADLLNPENVKEVIAKEQSWGESRKRNIINAYNLLVKLNRWYWEEPKCRVERKYPFIPTEEELDALIAGSGKKTSTFLQLLKETAMRSGEAKRLTWIDVDFERRTIRLNSPEKGSNPRMWRISTKLSEMLNSLPRKNEKIFGNGPITSMKTCFMRTRIRLSDKLKNQRLQKISFHTFRHWKATMLYHQTKDERYVQKFLGHKSIVNTEIYVNIEHAIFESKNDEFTVKVSENPEEVKSLLENGFEWVGVKDNLIFLKKRK